MELIKNKEVDDSLISNSSKITIKNVNINTLSNYQKILYNNTSNVQEEINKIFKSKTIDNANNKDNENEIINKQDIKNNININIIKNNIKRNSEETSNKNNNKDKDKDNVNNQKFLGQLSFTSVNSSEVDKEIGANSFLSDSSENDNN